MTARTANYDEGSRLGELTEIPVIAAEIVYQGTAVIINHSSGHAFSNDGTTNTLANSNMFAGIAAEKADNSSGAAAAINVKVYQRGTFKLKFSDTLTAASLGAKVYVNNVSDDSVVTTTSDTGNPQLTIGTIVEVVDATYAWVKIDDYINQVAANGA